MAGWTTHWLKGTGQEDEMTWIYDNLHICSLSVAKQKQDNYIYYTVNMCDESNNKENQSQFPVGEVTAYYGEHNTQQKENWESAVRHSVRLLKTEIPFAVHCFAGIHRSTLVSSAALTLAFPEIFPTLEVAHNHTLSQRIIGWKKKDTFAMMESIVKSLRTEKFTAFDPVNESVPTQSKENILFNRTSLF